MGNIVRRIVAVMLFAGILCCFENCGKVNFAAVNPVGSDNVNGVPAATGNSGDGNPTPFDSKNCMITDQAGNYAYPDSSLPATIVPFNESDVLVAYGISKTSINVWYMDEHAMMLGIKEVATNTAGVTSAVNYSISAFPSGQATSSVASPMVGATGLAGTDSSSCSGGAPDACSRPMFPALFVTDMTVSGGKPSGDWQYAGVNAAITPSAVYGTWKAAVRNVNLSSATPVTFTIDTDPAKNMWNLAGYFAPTGITSEGYGSAVTWDLASLNLVSGHMYRFQFMVHDGDQNKAGGDVGENCATFQAP